MKVVNYLWRGWKPINLIDTLQERPHRPDILLCLEQKCWIGFCSRHKPVWTGPALTQIRVKQSRILETINFCYPSSMKEGSYSLQSFGRLFTMVSLPSLQWLGCAGCNGFSYNGSPFQSGLTTTGKWWLNQLTKRNFYFTLHGHRSRSPSIFLRYKWLPNFT